MGAKQTGKGLGGSKSAGSPAYGQVAPAKATGKNMGKSVSAGSGYSEGTVRKDGKGP